MIADRATDGGTIWSWRWAAVRPEAVFGRATLINGLLTHRGALYEKSIPSPLTNRRNASASAAFQKQASSVRQSLIIGQIRIYSLSIFHSRSVQRRHVSRCPSTDSYAEWFQRPWTPEVILLTTCTWILASTHTAHIMKRYFTTASMDDIIQRRWHINKWIRSIGGMTVTREKGKYSEIHLAYVPLCPPQIPHGLARYGRRASALKGQRLTASAVTWPLHLVTLSY